MDNLSTNNNALFFSGIHMDSLGQLEAPALIGASNPGTFTSMAGGASLNSASVAKLLGLECAIIGMVGDDQQGIILAKTLQERSIQNHLHICQDRSTGSYTSIIEPDGNLHIAIADLGLNEEMHAQWLLEHYAKPMEDADIWFLNSNLSTQALLTLTNKDLPQRPEILTAASISPSKSQKLAPSLANIDVLFTNIAEASAMLNIIDGKQYDAPHFDAQTCIARIKEMGVSKGTLSQGGEFLWVWEKNSTHKFRPAVLDRVIDVTGAGDALVGTFLAGLAAGVSLHETAPLAISAARMIISTLGPFNSKIDMDELKSLAVHVKEFNI